MVRRIIKKTIDLLHTPFPLRVIHLLTYLLILTIYLVVFLGYIGSKIESHTRQLSEKLTISPIQINFSELCG